MRNALFASFAVIALCGCHEPAGDGPPDVQYGHVECAGCGMIVSNAPYASAIVLPAGSPDRVRIFDDINCMIEFEKTAIIPVQSGRYVHDVNSEVWVKAEEATFVRKTEVHTPMGSGLQATARSAATMPAESFTYEQLRDAAPDGQPRR